MANSWELRRRVRELLAAEQGTIRKGASLALALLYPSPYSVGMSSLGYQTIYREANSRPDTLCERAFLPDEPDAYRQSHTPLFTFESEQPVGNFPILAISIAYELEIPGLIQVLELSGLPPLGKDRGPQYPLVLGGGPLTFSNPLPVAPFVDLMILGEAEQAIHHFLDCYQAQPDREALLRSLAQEPGFYVPAIHGPVLPHIAQARDDSLPAYAAITTPHTELSDMFLIEAERGCSRGCTFCVMRRSTNGGMRLVAPEKILSLIPPHARRVGLVGAAVSDHPQLCDILQPLVDSGREIGISSLRAERLNSRLLELLRRGGYQTLTVASDAPSQRLRDRIEKGIKEQHLIRAAELAKAKGLRLLKVYMMIGLPGETDDDITELIAFTRELAKIMPVALGLSPFVAKFHTPLDDAPFEDIKSLEAKLKRLHRELGGVARVRPTSARWAWVEYQLAQGGPEAGLAALEAYRNGGSFGAWQRAFGELKAGPALHAGQCVSETG